MVADESIALTQRPELGCHEGLGQVVPANGWWIAAGVEVTDPHEAVADLPGEYHAAAIVNWPMWNGDASGCRSRDGPIGCIDGSAGYAVARRAHRCLLV